MYFFALNVGREGFWWISINLLDRIDGTGISWRVIYWIGPGTEWIVVFFIIECPGSFGTFCCSRVNCFGGFVLIVFSLFCRSGMRAFELRILCWFGCSSHFSCNLFPFTCFVSECIVLIWVISADATLIDLLLSSLFFGGLLT